MRLAYTEPCNSSSPIIGLDSFAGNITEIVDHRRPGFQLKPLYTGICHVDFWRFTPHLPLLRNSTGVGRNVSIMSLRSLKWLRKAGQSFNPAGVSFFLQLMTGSKHWSVPHISVPDIQWVDWAALKNSGFKGCVFDKDNTLTEPYAMEIHPRVRDSLEECVRVFEGRVVLLSNSAGLIQYDPEGHEADALEKKLGIPVIRHGSKKPAGNALALEAHFKCRANELVMIGDRYFTDVAYGNRNGLLTIRPAPFTSVGEPFVVRKVRRLEDFLQARWTRKGVVAPPHPMVAKPMQLVKDPGVW
eukprot:jgi/Mesvir1/21709/Mv04126-RA.1